MSGSSTMIIITLMTETGMTMKYAPVDLEVHEDQGDAQGLDHGHAQDDEHAGVVLAGGRG